MDYTIFIEFFRDKILMCPFQQIALLAEYLWN